ncbi:hypothetical protein [Streptomyces sp. NPDC088170]|uniref:hypothetical protein n=1 Tax=Streptomyces sp. NPDC088170 TaxID=3365834 RepID=UPI003806A24B
MRISGTVQQALSAFDLESLRLRYASFRPVRPDAWHQGEAAATAGFNSEAEEAGWIVDRATETLAAFPKATIGVITRSGQRRKYVDAAFSDAVHLRCQRWDLAIEDNIMVQRLVATVAQLPRQVDMERLRSAVIGGIDPSDVDTMEQATNALSEFESLAIQAGSPAEAAAQLRIVEEGSAIDPGLHLLNATQEKASSSTGCSCPASRTGTSQMVGPTPPSNWQKSSGSSSSWSPGHTMASSSPARGP